MAFHVRDETTDKVVRTLAERRKVSLTQAIREAAEAELARLDAERDTRLAAIREIQDEIARLPKTGLKADKAFYDWLSGDE